MEKSACGQGISGVGSCSQGVRGNIVGHVGQRGAVGHHDWHVGGGGGGGGRGAARLGWMDVR